MANHSSTKKAVRKTERVSAINKNRKSRIKTYAKQFVSAITTSPKKEVESLFSIVQSEIMKGVSKGIIKKNTASRKVKALSKMLKNKTE